jgi:hypothetical protein
MRSVKMIFAALLLVAGLGLFAGAYVMTFDRSNTYGLIMLGVVALFAAAQMIASLLGLTWRDTGSSDSGTDLFSGDDGDGD